MFDQSLPLRLMKITVMIREHERFTELCFAHAMKDLDTMKSVSDLITEDITPKMDEMDKGLYLILMTGAALGCITLASALDDAAMQMQEQIMSAMKYKMERKAQEN